MKAWSAYIISAAYNQNALQKTFTMEANTMYPDQTAPLGSSLTWVYIFGNIGNQRT